MSFPFQQQYDAMDCGPTCLYMVCRHYGKKIPLQTLREKTQIGKDGVNLLGISEAAESVGFRTLAVKISYEQLIDEAPFPCIVHWDQNHFVVVAPPRPKRRRNITVADPGKGIIKYTKEEFCEHWLSSMNKGQKEGVALLLEPTSDFYAYAVDKDQEKRDTSLRFSNLWKYVWPHRRLLMQLLVALGIGSLLQLVLPFLTQSVVDTGINTQNIHFVYLVLMAQLALFVGRTVVDFIRSWILLHISTRINISILTDFLIKLMKLPLSFFDSKQTGDILQRMNDHHRIESFLTGSSLNVLFSLVNLVVFSVVLAIFNLQIFLVFLFASILYAAWVVLFLKQRKKLDYQRFGVMSKEQGTTIQLIQGMQEIKLQGCEKTKRWEWERLQARLFKLEFKNLSINQFQQAGAFFINEGKNIFITFLSAKAVIAGQLTLGEMLAVQYIIGQLNSPIEQMISFVQSWQSAKISMDRLNEIHSMDNEEPEDKQFVYDLPVNRNVLFNNVSFTYPGAGNEPVLQDITLPIPQGKTTAIVGVSGSGKTTLLKLLLKFYDPQKGEVRVGEGSLTNISHRTWRSACGVVMQDSFIFSDTIARNIAVGAEKPDLERLNHAVKVANIREFIESLPLTYNTKIGPEGVGVSMGQRQRILIARAVYKNPDFIFFDEATNSLDANNERIILENLDEFFKGRTVIVVAHRLSTVRNADQIVVLNKGVIVERGSHEELAALRGEYYTLVKNQLELGSE
jgi:ATP-binding cassette, subfamily B, bacterial